LKAEQRAERLSDLALAFAGSQDAKANRLLNKQIEELDAGRD
jgi:hypothetical protein